MPNKLKIMENKRQQYKNYLLLFVAIIMSLTLFPGTFAFINPNATSSTLAPALNIADATVYGSIPHLSSAVVSLDGLIFASKLPLQFLEG